MSKYFNYLMGPYSLKAVPFRGVSGGTLAANTNAVCDPLKSQVDSAADPNTWVDTPGDCGMDPDHCDTIATLADGRHVVNFSHSQASPSTTRILAPQVKKKRF